jgi:hypothetical protein
MRAVPRLLKPRLGPVGIALTLYDAYRRLPPKQRKQVLELARRHGPNVAAKALKLYAKRRTRR